MLDLAIRGTLILMFAFAAAGLMRRASAAARHLLWASTLAGLLVLPAAVRLGPAVQVPVPMLAAPAAPVAAPVLAPASAPVFPPTEAGPTSALAPRARVRSRTHTHRSE